MGRTTHKIVTNDGFRKCWIIFNGDIPSHVCLYKKEAIADVRDLNELEYFHLYLSGEPLANFNMYNDVPFQGKWRYEESDLQVLKD